jgi:hypothetical protein
MRQPPCSAIPMGGGVVRAGQYNISWKNASAGEMDGLKPDPWLSTK